MRKFRRQLAFASSAMIIAAQIAFCGRAVAEDKLLTEAVNFTGTLTYLSAKVPGFMLVAVRDGEMAFAGFEKVPTNLELGVGPLDHKYARSRRPRVRPTSTQRHECSHQ